MDVMDEELNESELTILDHSQRRMQKKQLAVLMISCCSPLSLACGSFQN